MDHIFSYVYLWQLCVFVDSGQTLILVLNIRDYLHKSSLIVLASYLN